MDLQGPRVGLEESFSKVNSYYVDLLVLNIFWGDHDMVPKLDGSSSTCKSSSPWCLIFVPLSIAPTIFNVVWSLWSFSWLNSISCNNFWIPTFSSKIVDLSFSHWNFPTSLLPSSKRDSSWAARKLEANIQIGGNLLFFNLFFYY